jgi:hypothetical protein
MLRTGKRIKNLFVKASFTLLKFFECEDYCLYFCIRMSDIILDFIIFTESLEFYMLCVFYIAVENRCCHLKINTQYFLFKNLTFINLLTIWTEPNCRGPFWREPFWREPICRGPIVGVHLSGAISTGHHIYFIYTYMYIHLSIHTCIYMHIHVYIYIYTRMYA